MEVQEAIATGLIVLSQQLEMAQIEAWVVSFMAARLNSDNLSNNWGLSELMKSDQLREACLQHIKATFEATVATDFFVQLQPETVLYLLRADDLQVSNEESVLKAIGRWLNPLDEVDKTRLTYVLLHAYVYIYAIGEDPSVGTRTKVDKFDTRKRQWSECAAILTDRTHYAAVAVPVDEEGVICVCGGEIKVNFQSETSETCELYLPQEDR
ncbi:unnamed protein product [Dibothriocephalus latus]|uniref:BACK domain-containing protein n=1 Tax=Dibothriocephalus latus TaxID=60516 RepID=A0A3P7MCZ5_DIBLA|nr:unnamed protein product [Dibothriocephalus latus]